MPPYTPVFSHAALQKVSPCPVVPGASFETPMPSTTRGYTHNSQRWKASSLPHPLGESAAQSLASSPNQMVYSKATHPWRGSSRYQIAHSLLHRWLDTEADCASVLPTALVTR